VNPTIRRILTSTPVSAKIYYKVRQAYRMRGISRRAERIFENVGEFRKALHAQGVREPVDLRTKDGLTITIRQNFGDAMTVAEIFTDNSYISGITLPPSPVVIDIGGFVGDFALYAVKHLNASRVIVCEPSPKNWKLLLRNIANNNYEDRIVPVNKAVTDGGDVMMNLDAPDEAQCMVSAHYHSEQPLSTVPGISLSQLMLDNGIDTLDLLKIDCEGGEYAILASTPSDVFQRIRTIVFEYHAIDDWAAKLEQAKRRLRDEGYFLRTHHGLVSARRP
jgi:FkbM family methyltransferase